MKQYIFVSILFTTLVLLQLCCADFIEVAFTSNVRGNLMPYYNDTSCTRFGTCTTVTMDQFTNTPNITRGGCAQRHALVRAYRAQYPNLVLVDCGSYFWSSLLDLEVASTCMNYLKYDVINIGAADIYDGTAKLGSFLSNLTSTVDIVSSNMDNRDPNLLDTFANRPSSYGESIFTTSAVRIINGVKVLFIGLIPDTSLSFPNAANVKPASVNGTNASFRLRKAIFDAKKLDSTIALTIALTDTPYSIAREIASQVEGLDVMLCDMSTRSAYSEKFVSAFGQNVVIASLTQAASGTEVGLLRVEYDSTGVLDHVLTHTQTDYNALNMTDVLAADSTVKNIYDYVGYKYEPVYETFSQVIGSSTGLMSFYYGITKEARGAAPLEINEVGLRNFDVALGRIAVSAYLTACLDYFNEPCDVGFLNSGSFRAGLPAGDITSLDVMNALPFRNPVYVLQVTGATILKALQNSAYNVGWGGFAQTNLRVAYSYADINDYTQQIVEVKVLKDGVWDDLNELRTYTIAIPLYLFTGGDTYTMFSDNSFSVLTSIDTDLLLDYVSKNHNYKSLTTDNQERCLKNNVPWTTVSEPNCFNIQTALTKETYSYCPSDSSFCSAPPSILSMTNIFINTTSNCDSCSGIGSCYLRECTCPQPTTGYFAGLTIITGAGCDEVASLWDLGSGLTGFVYAIGFIAIAVCCVVLGLIIYMSDQRAIKATSPRIGIAMCVAGVVASLGMIFDLKQEIYAGCMTGIWLITIGYIVLFGSLFMRTYRIHTIFNNNSKVLSRVIFTDFDLAKRLGVLVAIDLLILIIFQAADPLEKTGVMLSTSSFQVALSCRSDTSAVLAVLLVYNGLLLLWGIYLAIQTRKVDSNFNESTFIGAAIYNCAFVCVIVIPLVYLLRESNPTITHTLQSCAIAYIVIFTICVVYIPRFMRVNEENTNSNTSIQMTSKQRTGDEEVPSVYLEYIQVLENQVKTSGGTPCRPAGVRVNNLYDASVKAKKPTPAPSSPVLNSTNNNPPAVIIEPREKRISAFDRQNALRNSNRSISVSNTSRPLASSFSGSPLVQPTSMIHSSSNTLSEVKLTFAADSPPTVSPTSQTDGDTSAREEGEAVRSD